MREVKGNIRAEQCEDPGQQRPGGNSRVNAELYGAGVVKKTGLFSAGSVQPNPVSVQRTLQDD